MTCYNSRMIAATRDLAECLKRMHHGAALRSALLMTVPTQIRFAQPLLDSVSLFEEPTIAYALIGGVAAIASRTSSSAVR